MTTTQEYTKKIKEKFNLNEAFSKSADIKENDKPSHAAVHIDIQPVAQTEAKKQVAQEAILPTNHIDAAPSDNLERPVYRARYTRKMTLNIDEDAYNTFYDIYAKRLLQGRGTNKGELINEALTLLHEKEKREGHI